MPRVAAPPPTQFAEFNLSGIGSMAKRRPPTPPVVDVGDVGVVGAGASKLQGAADADLQGVGAEGADAAADDAAAVAEVRHLPARSDAAAARRAHRGLRAQGAAGAVVGVEVVARLGPPLAEPRPVTTPRLFNLSGVERHDMAKAARERQLADEAAAAEKARKFAARKAPKAAAWKPEPSKAAPLVEAKPFNLSTNERGDFFVPNGGGPFRRRGACVSHTHPPRGATPARLILCNVAPGRARRENRAAPSPGGEPPPAEARGAAEARARRPARGMLAKTAFVPAKSTKPLTEIAASAGGSIARGEARRRAGGAGGEGGGGGAAREGGGRPEGGGGGGRAEALRANMVPKARDASAVKKKPFALKACAAAHDARRVAGALDAMRSAVRARAS